MAGQHRIDEDDSDNESDAPYYHRLNQVSPYITEYRLDEFFELDKKTKRHCLNIMHINCRSIKKNFNGIRDLLNNTSNCLTAIAVTETWLNCTTADAYVLPGYTFISKPRIGKGGGGVGFFVNSDVTHNIREDLCRMHPHIECVFIEIVLPNVKTIIIGCIYRPPNSDVAEFNSDLDLILTMIKIKKDQLLIVTGDFNLDLLTTGTNQLVSTFVNNMSVHSLFPCIHSPTRITTGSSTLLDNIFSNNLNQEFKSAIIYSDISDHFPVAIHLPLEISPINKGKNSQIKYRVYHQNALDAFTSQLNIIDWNPVYKILHDEDDPNKAYNTFFELYKLTFDENFPLRAKKNEISQQPREMNGLPKPLSSRVVLRLNCTNYTVWIGRY
jgi:Endonuclease-reverse transcriptase